MRSAWYGKTRRPTRRPPTPGESLRLSGGLWLLAMRRLDIDARQIGSSQLIFADTGQHIIVAPILSPDAAQLVATLDTLERERRGSSARTTAVYSVVGGIGGHFLAHRAGAWLSSCALEECSYCGSRQFTGRSLSGCLVCGATEGWGRRPLFVDRIKPWPYYPTELTRSA